MFHLCSEKFKVTAIEKNCILLELYQNSRTENRQQKRGQKENTFGFIVENVFGLNVKKLCNITLKRYAPILHIKSENMFDRN